MSKRHDVITLHEFGENRYSAKIGSFFETKTQGCYKLVLDYRPADVNAPLLIVVGEQEEEGPGSIFVMDWAFEGNVKSHSVFGYTPYGAKNEKRAKQRIGSIFRTKKHTVYQIVLNLWPVNSAIDMLCLEVSPDEMMDKYN